MESKSKCNRSNRKLAFKETQLLQVTNQENFLSNRKNFLLNSKFVPKNYQKGMETLKSLTSLQISMQTKNLLSISLFSLLFFLVSLQAALSTTISVRPPSMIVYANDYPNTTNVVSYYITLENVNDFPVNVTLTKFGEISGLVNILEPNFVLQPDETKNVGVDISLNGPAYASGLITVNFDAVGQMSVYYEVAVGINGRAAPPGQQCSGTITSCGFYPDCQDLTKLTGCYNGYYRSYYCSSNQPQYSPSCTNYCCQQFFGSQGICQEGVCRGPSQPLKTITINVTNGINESESAIVSLYASGTNNLINSTNVTGLGTISSTNSTVDFKLDYDSSKLSILLRNLNLDSITTTSNIILDSISPSIPNVTLRRAYKISVPSTFSFTGIALSINYSDLSVNEDLLHLYRCGNYDLVNNVCNETNETWIPIGMTKDTANDIVTAEPTNFSAYALGEGQSITTTTTTIPPTTTTTPPNQQQNKGGPTQSTTTTTTIPTTTTTIVENVTEENTTEETILNETQEQSSTTTGFVSVLQSNVWILVALVPIAAVGFLVYRFFISKSTVTYPMYKNYKSAFGNSNVSKTRSKKRKHSSKETMLFLQ
jgi:hypothetical protein